MGKPLIAYSIEQAKNCGYIDRVIVSTDGPQIARVARSCGAEVPFLRPARLAGDKSATMDVLRHAVGWLGEHEGYEFDILVLLHANTPLRSIADIRECIRMAADTDADNVFSVTPCHRNPYFNMVEKRNGRVRLSKQGDYVARQQAPAVYDMNSSIYVWKRRAFLAGKKLFSAGTDIYVMPKERSVDIDDRLDFALCELILRNGGAYGR